MTIRTIECADCGAPVPSGRLACPSCGALLAAVAGAPPPPIRVIETPSPAAEAGAETPRKGSKTKGRAAANGGAIAGSDATSQPAANRATQAVSRAATAAGRAATAATAKAKTTAAAATAAVAPAKASANGAAAGEPAAPATSPADKPRSPGKVAAAIAMAVAAGPTGNGSASDVASGTVAPKASGGTRPYPVPTPAPAASQSPAAPPTPVPPPAAAPPSRASRAAAMPASVGAPPTASARAVPAQPPARPGPSPADRRPTPAAPAGSESTTRSAPAQLAYLMEPDRNRHGRGAAPALTTNGTSAYLLDPDPLDDQLDEESGSPWPPLLQPEPALVGRPYVSGSVTTGGAAAMPPRPGAYLPPNSVMPPSSVSRPAQTGSPGGAAAAAATTGVAAAVGTPTPAGIATPMPGTMPPGDGGGDPTPPLGGQPSNAHDALAMVGSAVTSLLDRIDRARVTTIAGWFVVAGSALSTLGFLMPWSSVVIGARGTGGYLDDWGLASPTHLFVVVALLGLLALGVLENPVPAWLRTGVLGLALGGLLLGLTWPYTIGPLGAELGATLTFFGSFALLIGGAVASWATRHGRIDPAV